MMDCVLPTRAARHACLYTSEGRVLIKNARYIEDQRPIDPNCYLLAFAGATRARIFGIFSPPERSPRRSWRPTTMSTFTLT